MSVRRLIAAMQQSWTNTLFLGVVFLAVASLFDSVEASILLPTQPAFEILEVSPESDDPASAGGPAVPADSPPDDSKLNESPAPSPASSSGAASGSSTSVISSATGLSGSAVISSDTDLVGWFLFEFSLSVPDPPGSDLLRPPQTQSGI